MAHEQRLPHDFPACPPLTACLGRTGNEAFCFLMRSSHPGISSLLGLLSSSNTLLAASAPHKGNLFKPCF